MSFGAEIAYSCGPASMFVLQEANSTEGLAEELNETVSYVCDVEPADGSPLVTPTIEPCKCMHFVIDNCSLQTHFVRGEM